MLQYLMDQDLVPKDERRMYTTFLASSFRDPSFRPEEAHAKGIYLMDKPAFWSERRHVRGEHDGDVAVPSTT